MLTVGQFKIKMQYTEPSFLHLNGIEHSCYKTYKAEGDIKSKTEKKKLIESVKT